ncbi:MAG TPA: glutathione S-transferase family protein [Burkholderiaceae bacterium]|nr:glutathione S-transferase family protein [Burkholderiaceae bacterium]HQR75847.1 glutathione S-transferase family protein [Burkholderiaceae bacterium]
MTTRYVLYTARRSGAASVEVMLGALGLEFELKDATPWSDPPGPYFEELKTVNPLGQLPTLVTPGGEILTESVAVLWTLLERHPSDWVPALSTRDRASCLRWMQFVAATVYTAVGVADYPARWTTSRTAAARAAVERAAVARMKLGWDIVAQAFPQKSGFLLGARPYVCDVYLANLSRWWKMRDYLNDAHPRFAAMMRRVDRLPEVAPVWKRHWT